MSYSTQQAGSAGEREELVCRTQQRIEELQQAIANISAVRKRLQYNAQEVKCEISTAFSRQLERLRNREVWLCQQVEVIQQAKEDVLSGQQDRLCQLLGGLTASLDLTGCDEPQPGQLTDRLSQSVDRLDEIDLRPAETPHLCFRSDGASLQEAIRSFGHIDSRGLALETAFAHPDTTSACLPKSFEDYEDPQHHVLYKTLSGNDNCIQVSIPKLQKPIAQWLSYTPTSVSATTTPAGNADNNFAFLPSEEATKLSHVMEQGSKSSQRSLQQWLVDIKQDVQGEEEDFELISPTTYANTVSDCFEQLSVSEELEEKPIDVDGGYFRDVQSAPTGAWLSSGGVARESERLAEEELMMLFKLHTSLDDWKQWLDNSVQAESSDSCCKGSCQVSPSVDIENLDLLLCAQDADKNGRKLPEKDVDESENNVVGAVCRANELCQSFSECVCDENCGQTMMEEDPPTSPPNSSLREWLLQSQSLEDTKSPLFSYFQAASKIAHDWLSPEPNTEVDPLPYSLFPVFQKASHQLEWLLQSQASRQENLERQEEADAVSESIQGILAHMQSICRGNDSQWLQSSRPAASAQPPSRPQSLSPRVSEWLMPTSSNIPTPENPWKQQIHHLQAGKVWLQNPQSESSIVDDIDESPKKKKVPTATLR